MANRKGCALDVLSNLVSMLRLRGDFYGRLVLGSPFALNFPSDVGHFFIVLSGQCRLRLGAAQPSRLSTGDFVFLPSREPFSLLSIDPDLTPVERSFSEEEGRSYSQDGLIDIAGDLSSGAELISGCFHFAAHEEQLLFEHMDGVLIFRATGRTASPWLHSIFGVIAEEAQPGRLGAYTIIDRLAEVLLVHALRSALANSNTEIPNWLNALNDPQLGKAIREMHFAPDRDWSLAALASVAGMSRSGFAARFRERTGRTPMEHLIRWRMHKSASLLTDGTNRQISEIVSLAGYTSEAAFRRKFTETFGLSPRRYRTQRKSGI